MVDFTDDLSQRLKPVRISQINLELPVERFLVSIRPLSKVPLCE
jgi:hypothetical protein